MICSISVQSPPASADPNFGHPPRATKRYENLSEVLTRAFKTYVDDIHAGRFPTEAEAIHMKPGEYDKLMALTGRA